MGVCLPNIVCSSVKSVIHKREVCNQVAFNSHSTVKTGIIEWCAMSLRIPYFRNGAKSTAKEERLSPSERHKKTKKHQTLPEGATLTTQHTTRLFQFYGTRQLRYWTDQQFSLTIKR